MESLAWAAPVNRGGENVRASYDPDGFIIRNGGALNEMSPSSRPSAIVPSADPCFLGIR